MKIKHLLHPIFLFLIPSIGSITFWLFTPEDWFRDWKITQKIDTIEVLIPWFLALLFFLAGYLLRSFTYVPNSSRVFRTDGSDFWGQWITFAIASLSMVTLVALVVRGHGFGGLMNAYALRENYVAGITTFTLLTSAAITFAASIVLLDRGWSKVALIPLFAAIAYASHRAFFASERIAILIPFISICSIYLLLRYRTLSPRILLVTAFGLVTVLLIFVGAEYFRSYSAKMSDGSQIIENPLLYGLQRFVLYFSTSVNSGGTEFSFFRDGSISNPLFTNTFGPLATVLYNIFGIDPLGFDKGRLGFGTDIAVSMGLFNPEFNNKWGVATPFTEGWIPGAIFWMIWGFIGTHYYRRVTEEPPTPWTLTLYGLFVAAFVDNQSRVGMLAGAHFLLPFMWLWAVLQVARLYGGKNSSILKSRRMPAIGKPDMSHGKLASPNRPRGLL